MLFGMVSGVFITHIMRLLILRGKILKLNILRQVIYILFTSIFFSFIYALVNIWFAATFHWGEEIFNYFVVKRNKLLLITVTAFNSSVLLGIWNLIYFSVHYIQKSQKEQIEKIRLESELRLQQFESENSKVELQKEKTELEMQALRAQMNPHFIFNSLNSINRFILQKQGYEATEYLTKFSRLIRMILNSSSNASVSLAQDLDALKLYLELESLRFEKKFSYKIDCDSEVDTDFVQVPPMLLQPFVENAIWHGLMNKEGEGHLWISINQQDATLICTITDDGIGRKRAAELQEKSGKHKSMGMKITESRIAMMQKMSGENKSVEIRDLVDAGGCVAGTEVSLRIPID
jgi:sensor histidine kinase YesM